MEKAIYDDVLNNMELDSDNDSIIITQTIHAIGADQSILQQNVQSIHEVRQNLIEVNEENSDNQGFMMNESGDQFRIGITP